MSYENIKIAFSSCPNDTFMFDALINGRIDGEGLKYDLSIADIEELNTMVVDGIPDVSKISCAAYPLISDRYQIMSSGSALGYKNGPLVISKHKLYPDELEGVKMAIPGKMTTANFLLSILFPKVTDKSEYLFSDIEDVVSSEETDAGLIIHESRFSYLKKGLRLVSDLGELWEERFNLPIALGAIVVRRNLSEEIKLQIQSKISESVQFGFKNREASMSYIKSYAQNLDEDVINKHIELYVNEFSIDLGEKGREAIDTLFSKGEELGLFNLKNKEIYL